MTSEDQRTVRTRVGAVDYLRFVSAAGILWFHAKAPFWQIAYSGLAAFLFLSIALPGGERARKEPISFIALRARRMLLPFLLWSAFYSAMKLSQAYLNGIPLMQEFRAWMWLTGPVLPLWFLPYAFLSSVVFVIFQERFLKRDPIAFLSLTIMAVVTQVIVTLYLSEPLPIPLAQWAYALPVVLFATAWRVRSVTPHACTKMIAALILSLGIQWLAVRDISSEIIIGIGAAIACMSVARRTLPFSGLAAFISLPIYFLHPAGIALFKEVGILDPLALGLAALVACCAIGFLLKGTRLGSVLF